MRTPKSAISKISAPWKKTCLLACVIANIPAAVADMYRIEPQSLDSALKIFAKQANIQLMYTSEDVAALQSTGLSGDYTPEEAIKILLKNSGLRYEISGDNLIVIQPVTHAPSQNSRTSASDPILVFEEIIVTATKRSQSLQDTAMSISALGSEEIERRSLVNMSDYLNSIPGVNAQEFAPGANKIVMRGIGAGLFEEATVATYFGEVPVNALSPNSAVTGSATDLKLIDIERVEVLRGPQGTLYGSGSMGGTVRNIPTSPNLQEFEGKLSPGYSNTADFGGTNTKISGVVNIPIIEDELALRIVAYNYKNSGYIKNVAPNNTATGSLAELSGAAVSHDDVFGDSEYNGARASLLWSKGNMDVSLMALTQNLEQDGLLRGSLALGAYEASPLSIKPMADRGEFADDSTDIYNLVVQYDFGLLSLLSSSSWLDGQTGRGFDLNRSFGLAGAIVDDWSREGFTQEIRMNSQWDGPLQFIGGIYYEDLEASRKAKAEWIGSLERCCGWLGTTPDIDPNNLFTIDHYVAVRQKAIFGELSYRFSDQFSLTVGSRWFDYEREDANARSGAFNGGSFSSEETDSEEDGTNYMANVTYTPDGDSLVYAQWSQGFRLGRPVQPVPAAVCDENNDRLLDGTDVSIDAGDLKSDTLDSYELGGKFTLLDSALVLNASIYQIDWTGIPVFVNAEPSCGFVVQLNAGKAVSQGIEMESSYYLTEGFQVSVGASYVNAELSKDSANLGEKGTRLPGSPEWNAHAGFQYEFSLGANEAFLRSDYTYISTYHDDIAASFPKVGGYGTLSMRAGISLNKINLELYGTNLTNVDDLAAVQFGTEVFRLTPRTLGVELGYYF